MPKSLSLYLSYDSPRNPYKEPWRVVEEVKLGILNPQGEMLTDKRNLLCNNFEKFRESEIIGRIRMPILSQLENQNIWESE